MSAAGCSNIRPTVRNCSLRDVYVVSAFDNEWFDKTSAVQLQHRLTHAARSAALMEVRLGTNPQDIALPPWLLGSNDGMFDAAPRLLFGFAAHSIPTATAS